MRILIIIILWITYFILTYESPEKFITNLIHNNTKVRFVYDKMNSEYDILVKDKNMFNRFISNGEVGFSEGYMNNEFDMNVKSVIYELLKKKKLLENTIKSKSFQYVILNLIGQVYSYLPNNTLTSSKKNISHHYDIGNDLYEKMLGETMQYTCAYFNKPNMTLNEAEYAKMNLIIKKLNIKEGMSIIDLGCGFGSFGYYIVNQFKNVKVIGCSLSEKQVEYANNNYKHPNLKILLEDYRNMKGKYDRVYSVGLCEHIGRKNYHIFFNKCYDLLKKDGIMLLHTIGTNSRVWHSNHFAQKYIFPGGELPHQSNLVGKFIEKWHLEDWQNFGLSYEKTLLAWRQNIDQWQGLDNYDEKFRRMWDIYLYGCAAAFHFRHICLWQIVYTKINSNRKDDLHYIRNC